MPKKPLASIDTKRLDGLVNLFFTLNAQLKENTKEADEMKGQIKKLLKAEGTPEGQNFVYVNSNHVKAILNLREVEKFDMTAAMDVLNALPQKVAEKYQVVATTKDLIYQALADGVISPEDAKKCVSMQTQEALLVSKEEDNG